MPKVPMLEQPSVSSRPIGTPYQGFDASTGQREVAQGLNQVGNAVGQVADAYDRARRRANNVRRTEELGGVRHDINSTLWGASDASQTGEYVPGGWGLDVSGAPGSSVQAPHGFMQLRGKQAAQHSEQAVEHLRKRIDERAAAIQDEELRREFLSDANVLYEDARVQIEKHVGQEFATAEQAAQKSLVEQGLTAVAASYNDEDSIEKQFKVMADALRRGSSSKEEGDAKVAELQGQIAKVRLGQYLAAGDAAGAAQAFAKSERVFDFRDTAKYREAITTVRAKTEGDQRARALVEASRDEDTGLIDEAKALAAYQALPEKERTPQTEQALVKWMGVESDKKKAVVGDHYNRALTAFLERHSLSDVNGADEAWLRRNDPKGWLDLEQLQQRQIDRWRSQRNGKEPKTLEQANKYGELLLDMEKDPDTYRKMSVPEFSRKWAADLDFGDYQKALQALAKLQGEKAPKTPKAGVEVQSEVKTAFRRAFGLPADESKWSEDQVRLYSRTVDAVKEREEEAKKANPTKPPTTEQYQEWIGEHLVKGEVPDTGLLSNDKVTRAEYEQNPKYTGKPFLEQGVPRFEDLPAGADTAMLGVLRNRGLEDSPQNRADVISAVARRLRSRGVEVTPQAIADMLGGLSEDAKRRERQAIEQQVNADTEQFRRSTRGSTQPRKSQP